MNKKVKYLPFKIDLYIKIIYVIAFNKFLNV